MGRPRLLSANIAFASIAIVRWASAQSLVAAAQPSIVDRAAALLTASQPVATDSPLPSETRPPPDPPSNELPPPDEPPPRPAPPPINVQLALRTGYALPAGSADGGEDMSDFFAGQLPFLLEIGAKSSDAIFVGGYLGFGLGSVAGKADRQCSTLGLSCSTTSFRGGFEILGYFAPGQELDPWIGYGIGFESASVNLSGPGGDASVSMSGPEWAHLMAGFDYRFDRRFGLGFLVDLSFAEYTRIQVEGPGTNGSGEVGNKTIHEWVTLGVRGVVFP
jgi:hypothetical protein